MVSKLTTFICVNGIREVRYWIIKVQKLSYICMYFIIIYKIF